MNDIIVRLQDMPIGIKGVTLLDEAGDYNVYINSRLSVATQHKAYLHELQHIKRNDFYNDLSIFEAEQISYITSVEVKKRPHTTHAK